MPDYRPVEADEVDAYRSVLDYAFRAEAGPDPERDEDEPEPLGARRGLFDGDSLLTTGAHHRFTVSVRDEWLQVAGLSAVATLPEHRRRGLVRQLVRESLAEYRDWERPVCLLWPFKHAFYRRLGWGRLNDLGRYEFEPDALSAVADHPAAGGEFRRLGPDDYPALQALDERFAERYDLAMRRTEAWYRNRYFRSRTGDPFVYGWFEDDELRGAIRYDVEEADDDSRLRVWEFGAPDDAATVNLLRFLHRHEDQADRIRGNAPVDDLLFDLVEDPASVELTVRPGPMGRIVDVVSAIEALPAPADVETTLALAVTDDLAGWNDDTFVLDASGGRFDVRRADADGTTAEVSIETLSRLALGTTTARRAAVAGALEADAAAVEQLERLFPPREAFLREFF
jgi:predicted acetyltransferase